MTPIRSEKVESTEVEDSNLAAVSEVEAGIRDFVRNDVAYLRRPAQGTPSSADTAEKTAGINNPPVKPCITRKISSTAKLPLKAQPTDAMVKRLTAVTNSQRNDSTLVSKPVSGIAITSAIR